jgi:hypothetical protein
LRGDDVRADRSVAVRPASAAGVKHTELWARLEDALGPAYARSWASMYVLAELGGRTVEEALTAGVEPKVVWRAVWAALELPAKDR